MPPRVSLAMPVHNGETFVAQAIRSILDQDYPDFELVITDNASRDATEAICQMYAAKDKRIRYVRNATNQGAAANFNKGFSLMRGELFKWCAHDDRISENFLTECVRALDQHPEAVLAYGRPEGLDEDDQPVAWSGTEAERMDCDAPASRFRRAYTAQGFDTAMFGVIRRDALLRTSLHRRYYGSDIALLAELALLGSFVRADQAVFFNRDHSARSIRISELEQRRMWHAPSASGWAACENLNRVAHLFELCMRHRQVASPWRTLLPLTAWTLTPSQLARYALDGIGLLSPRLRRSARARGHSMLQATRRLLGLGHPRQDA